MICTLSRSTGQTLVPWMKWSNIITTSSPINCSQCCPRLGDLLPGRVCLSSAHSSEDIVTATQYKMLYIHVHVAHIFSYVYTHASIGTLTLVAVSCLYFSRSTEEEKYWCVFLQCTYEVQFSACAHAVKLVWGNSGTNLPSCVLHLPPSLLPLCTHWSHHIPCTGKLSTHSASTFTTYTCTL